MGQKIEQFSPADWTRDTRLLTLSAKGAWIDILCALWGSATRGALTLSVSEWARIMGCTKDEAVAVVNELVTLKVMDVCAEPPCKLPLLSSLKSAVRISSRRILREEEKKQKNRERVEHFRKASPVDDAWIASLKANPAYSHLNIEDEIGKLTAWLTTEKAQKLGRTLNRGFIVQNLNKQQRPLEFHSSNGNLTAAVAWAEVEARRQGGKVPYTHPAISRTAKAIGGIFDGDISGQALDVKRGQFLKMFPDIYAAARKERKAKGSL